MPGPRSGGARARDTRGGPPGARAEIVVIQNPAAGTGRPERLRRRIRAGLDARGLVYELHVTGGPGHAARLAEEAVRGGCERVLVAGGDGTVLEAVSALTGTDAMLGLLPVGTGNQLAANLRIPRRLERALQVALTGRPRRIDVGLVDGRPFTCIAGAGFDATVVNPDSGLKRRFGYLAYVAAAVRAILRPQVCEWRITVDGREVTGRGIGVEVANLPGLAAPGLRRPVPIVPDGGVEDGLLDVCLLAVESTYDCVSALISILMGRHERNPRLRYFRGRDVRVEATPAVPVQLDGERPGLETPFRAGVRRRGLTVVVPATKESGPDV